MLTDKELELVEVLEGDACAAGHSAEGVFGDVDLQLGLAADTLVEASQEGAAAGQVDAVLIDIGGQLGGSGGEGVEDSLLDAGDALVEGVGDLLVVDRDFLGETGEEVAAEGTEVLWGVGQFADGGADGDFHLFGHTHTDNHIVLPFHIVYNVVVEFVTSHLDGGVADDATQRDDSDLGGTASDVDHHVAFGLQHVDADTDGCCHRLMNHADFFGASLFGALADGTFFDIGDAAGDADDHAE